MCDVRANSVQRGKALAAIVLMLVLAIAPSALWAGKKKKKEPAESKKPEVSILKELDYSKIVWPNPPAITRIKYLNYFAGEPYHPPAEQKKKSSWMDRLAGSSPQNDPKTRKPFALGTPWGIAVDSKGKVYVADTKVGAIFIFNPENRDDVQMIKNGVNARFEALSGLAMDDSDELFAADSALHHVLVFTPQHKVESVISEGMVAPGGLAIDTENRFLYVADIALDQVLVYDADPPHKLLRKIGTTGKNHTLTTPGDFAKPVDVAVDSDGNLYVTDTLNDRVEIFDPDGEFISTFGKPGDGPAYFARPKGIAIDSDGHVWVVDAMQNRVKVFDKDGRLLIWMGGAGLLPGQFAAPAGITIDKNNRVFTTEQYPGRVQEFRYITQAEALAAKEKQDAEMKHQAQQNKAGEKLVSAKPAAKSPQ